MPKLQWENALDSIDYAIELLEGAEHDVADIEPGKIFHSVRVSISNLRATYIALQEIIEMQDE